MKKMIILCSMLLCITFMTACGSPNADTHNTSDKDSTIIEMELDQNYDESVPFINEKLFCVLDDLDNLTAEGTFEMDGEKGILDVKNNKTNEVLWSKTWEQNVNSEKFSVSLADLKKDDEYVVCFTGTKINQAKIKITFNNSLVEERERPLQ